MLDLDDPLTRYVFEASRQEDEIRQRIVALQQDPAADRVALLNEILSGPLPELYRLLRERFDNRPGIAKRLDAIERAILDDQPIDEIWRAFSALDQLSPDTFGTAYI